MPEMRGRHEPTEPTQQARPVGDKRGAAVLRPRDAYQGVPILKAPLWNHEVAAYFYLGGMSAGAALVGSLAGLTGGEQHRALAHTAHYVAFAAFLPCPPLLIDDLGVPARFHHMLRVFKPASPMNLGAWVFLVHGAVAGLTAGRALAAEDRLPLLGPLLRLVPERALAGLALPGALMLAGYTGVLLGTTSIPVWYTSQLLGGLFTASAISTGVAAVALAGTLTHSMSEADRQALTTFGLVSGCAEMALLGGYLATSGRAAVPYLRGEGRLLMAGAVVALAASIALEAAATLRGHRRPSVATGVLALASGALLRWAVVRAGRASARDREGTLEAMKPRRGYPGWGPHHGQPTPP